MKISDDHSQSNEQAIRDIIYFRLQLYLQKQDIAHLWFT